MRETCGCHFLQRQKPKKTCLFAASVYYEFMTTRWIAMAVSAFLIAGCGKKDASSSPTPTPETQTAEPAPVVQPPKPSAPPVLVQPVQGDMGPLLDQLTQVLRKYSVENRRVPKSLDEVVAAGYLKEMPPAPAGKKFTIEPKKLQVVLVDQ
jgi:hypothetical protein